MSQQLPWPITTNFDMVAMLKVSNRTVQTVKSLKQLSERKAKAEASKNKSSSF